MKSFKITELKSLKEAFSYTGASKNLTPQSLVDVCQNALDWESSPKILAHELFRYRLLDRIHTSGEKLKKKDLQNAAFDIFELSSYMMEYHGISTQRYMDALLPKLKAKFGEVKKNFECFGILLENEILRLCGEFKILVDGIDELPIEQGAKETTRHHFKGMIQAYKFFLAKAE